jgi:hypothetical protein
MSKIYHRPNQAVDYGQVQTVGANPLGDNNDGTSKSYVDGAGSIALYPTFDPGLIPGGRDILAVKCGFRQANGGTFNVFNGWVMGYLRVDNKRVLSTKTYKQDGGGGARTIEGTSLYKPALAPWTAAEISKMQTDVGAATGEFGPNKNNIWCICTEAFIVLVISDDVPLPSNPSPDSGAVVATSSVNFAAKTNLTQSEQPIGTVFQVARNSGFTDDVRNFVGGLTQDMTAQMSYYASNRKDSTYTNLGPGQWFMRMKNRDFRGVESGWTSTTSFTITHGPLPVPSISKPLQNATVPSPYETREATFATDPTGDRIVGAEWQFSKVSTFASGVVSWTNRVDGRFDKGVVSYNPQPDPTVTPGKFGQKVSSDDPNQYLSQGVWYGRVRAHDIWGQTGQWSASMAFTVSHPPVITSLFPENGKAFDDDAQPVKWNFADPWAGDIQSAYQVTIFDGSSNLIYNSNKISSSVSQAQVVVPDQYLLQNLIIGVAVWDLDDVTSAVWQGTFRLQKSPVITLPYPAADEAIVTGQPSLDWDVTFGRAGVTQKSFRVDFVRRDTGVVQYSSGVVNSAVTQWSAPTAVLRNLSEYQLMLTVVDTDDLATTLLRNFSTNYIRPESIFAEAYGEAYEEDGFVTVIWPNADVDPLFVQWNIVRRNVTDPDNLGEWELAGVVDNKNTRIFHDWTVSGETKWRYSVVQVATRFGALVESLPDENGYIVTVHSSNYWLIDENDEANNVRLHQVVNDKYTDKIEMSEYHVINGKRRVNYGDAIGMEGSLSCQVRHSAGVTATQQLKILRSMQLDRHHVIMRDPFGNYTKVALGEVSVSRIPGVGINEYADIEIPYYEVD